MAPQTAQEAASGSDLSRMTGAFSNAPPPETHHQCRPHLGHCNAANAATGNTTQYTRFKNIGNSTSSENQKQHEIGCECIHIVLGGCELTVQYKSGVRREEHDQFITARNGKPPMSTKAFVRADGDIKHHVVVSSGIFGDEFQETHPGEWTEQAWRILEDATVSYLVEAIAESHL